MSVRTKKRNQALTLRGNVTGIDLDGNTATLVTVSGGEIIARKTITAETSNSALEKALSSVKSSEQVRVVLSSPATRVRTYTGTVPKDTLTRTRQLLRVVGADENYTVAHQRRMLASGETNTLVSATRTRLVANAADILDTRWPGREIVSPCAVSYLIEGTHLRIGRKIIDVSITTNEVVLGYKVLTTVGLDALTADLGGPGANERILACLAGNTGDVVATAETRRWLTGVAAELTEVINQWRAEGISVPKAVTVSGPGSNSRVLREALNVNGLDINQSTLVSGRATTLDADELEVLIAFCAAMSYGQNAQESIFLSPKEISAKLKYDKRAARRANYLLAAGVIAALCLPAAIPAGAGWVLERSQGANAQGELQALVKDPQALAEIESIALSRGGVLTVAQNAALGEAAATILAAQPPAKGALVSVTTNKNMLTVTTRADADEVVEWLRSELRNIDNLRIRVVSFTDENNHSVLTVQYSPEQLLLTSEVVTP
jgi:hypothetical protein